ncbi:hypothetical protein AgCh_029437 [Apium graveolens]
MVQSGAAFARQFTKDEALLDMIDKKILNRGRNRATPGAWCTGHSSWFTNPCSQGGDVNILRPRIHAKKFQESQKPT